MDINSMFAVFAANPGLVTQFQAFLATQNANQTQPHDAIPMTTQDHERNRDRSPTIDRTSPIVPREAQLSQDHQPRRGRSPTIGRTSDATDPPEEPRRGRSRTPRHRSSSSDAEPPSRKANPSRRPKSPTPFDPPVPSRARSPSCSAPTSPTRHSPHLRSRSPDSPRQDRQLPAPRRKRSLSIKPDDSPRPSKHAKPCSPAPDDTPKHAYDTCRTSYETQQGMRGGRIKVIVNDKEEIDRTRIERLMTREKKHKYVARKGHLFGEKHDCHFNPYTFNKVNEKVCKKIDKPKGFQIGRGGQYLIHEIIGLRDDYDTFNDIRGVVRKSCMKWRPPHVGAEGGGTLTWGHYSASARKKIYDYAYSHYPFLFHFRDKTGENSWAVTAIAQQYLASSRSYIKSLEKTSRFLCRNASGRKVDGKDDADTYYEDDTIQLDEPQQPPADYINDYIDNAPAAGGSHRAATAGAGPSRRKRSRSPSQTTRRGYDDDERPKKKRAAPPLRSPSPIRRPTEPTARDIRRADKTVANEEARNKALGSSRDKVGALKPTAPKPAAASKGKGKQREDTSKSKRGWGDLPVDGNDDDETDEEPVRKVTKKVAARKPARAESPPEPTPVPKKVTKHVQKAATKQPHPAQVNDSPEPTPALKKVIKNPKNTTKGSKAKADKEQEHVEDEEPVQKKRTARPKMRPPPTPEPEAAPTPGPSSSSEALDTRKSAQVTNTTSASEAPGAPGQETGEPRVVAVTKLKVRVPPSTRELRRRD